MTSLKFRGKLPYSRLAVRQKFETIPSTVELEEGYAITSDLLVGFPADVTSKDPQKRGTHFDGAAAAEVYHLETKTDLADAVTYFSAQFLQECGKVYDKLKNYVPEGDTLDDIRDHFNSMRFLAQQYAIGENRLKSSLKKKRREEDVDNCTFGGTAEEAEILQEVDYALRCQTMKIVGYYESIPVEMQNNIDQVLHRYRYRVVFLSKGGTGGAQSFLGSNSNGIDFSDTWKLIYKHNLGLLKAENAKTSNKRAKGTVENDKQFEQLGLDPSRKSRIELLTSTEDYFHMLKRLLPLESCMFDKIADDPICQGVLTYANGATNEDIGPWSPEWRNSPLREATIENATHPMIELSLDYTNTSDVIKYHWQLNKAGYAPLWVKELVPRVLSDFWYEMLKLLRYEPTLSMEHNRQVVDAFTSFSQQNCHTDWTNIDIDGYKEYLGGPPLVADRVEEYCGIVATTISTTTRESLANVLHMKLKIKEAKEDNLSYCYAFMHQVIDFRTTFQTTECTGESEDRDQWTGLCGQCSSCRASFEARVGCIWPVDCHSHSKDNSREAVNFLQMIENASSVESMTFETCDKMNKSNLKMMDMNDSGHGINAFQFKQQALSCVNDVNADHYMSQSNKELIYHWFNGTTVNVLLEQRFADRLKQRLDVLCDIRSGNKSSEHYSSLLELQQDAVNFLFTNVPQNADICESTKAVLNHGTDPNNGFANCDPDQSARWTSDKIGVEYMESCNALAKINWAAETLQVCSLHWVYTFIFLAAMDSMIPHNNLFANVILCGAAECGKSFIMKLLSMVMIAGTWIFEQQSTDKAHRVFKKATCQLVTLQEEAGTALTKKTTFGNSTDECSLQQEAVKSQCTENKIMFTTPLPIDEYGRRAQLNFGYTFKGARISAGNVQDMKQIPDALLSRFTPMIISKLEADNRTAGEKDAQKMFYDMNDKEVKTVILWKKGFQHVVAFVGSLIEAGLIRRPNDISYQVVLLSIRKTLNKMGVHFGPRVQEIVAVFMQQYMLLGVYELFFNRPYSIFGKGCDKFTHNDLLDIQSHLVCGPGHAWSAFQQVLVGKLKIPEAVSIMKAFFRLLLGKKHGTYSDLFMSESFCKKKKGQQDDAATHEVMINFNYVRFALPKGGLMKLCGELSHLMQGNKMSQEGVHGCISEVFLKADSWYSTIKHRPMDLLIPACTASNGFESVVKVEQSALNEIFKADAKGYPHGIKPEMLNAIQRQFQKLYKLNGYNILDPHTDGSEYFPFESDATDDESKREWPTMVMEDTGYLLVNTYMMRLLCCDGYAENLMNDFRDDSTGLKCMTTQFYGYVPNSTQSITPELRSAPYLILSQMLKTGDKSVTVQNQGYMAEEVYKKYFKDMQHTDQNKRAEPRFYLPNHKTLTLYAAYQHISQLMEVEPILQAWAGKLMQVDPMWQWCLLPYIAREMVKNNLYDHQDPKAVSVHIEEFIETNIPDFLRPMRILIDPPLELSSDFHCILTREGHQDNYNVTKIEYKPKELHATEMLKKQIIDTTIQMLGLDCLGGMAKQQANFVNPKNTEEQSWIKRQNKLINDAVKCCGEIVTPQCNDGENAFVKAYSDLNIKDFHSGEGYINAVRELTMKLHKEQLQRDPWLKDYPEDQLLYNMNAR